ncbi:MAG: Fe-S protein assembly co-chaperone HscB [Chromatiales bacterium]
MLDLSKNYFELFGLPIDFRIDLAELSVRYRDLQKIMHPDRYASAPEHEQRLAMQGATQVNEAFATLKDPLLRAQYMLELNGVDAKGENLTTSDTGFLMQQMEMREALAEARQAEDPLEVVGDLLDQIGKAINVQVAQLAILLEQATAENLTEASQCIYKMQFLKKLHAEAEALEADLEDSI